MKNNWVILILLLLLLYCFLLDSGINALERKLMQHYHDNLGNLTLPYEEEVE